MAVRDYTLTLDATVQRLSAVLTDTTRGGINDEAFRQVIFSSDPANANAIYVGGKSTITSTDHGFSLDPTQASQVPVSVGPFETGAVKLSDFYVKGTNAEKLHVLCIPF